MPDAPGPGAADPRSERARDLVRDADFVWHQRFELAPGVVTPGENDIVWLLNEAAIPDDMSGMTALDIGTTNGGAAFELERRGAERVVAIDIEDPRHYGFDVLSEFVGSGVEYVRASTYEAAAVLDERFDVVLFLGVLYHLRHPLLALDNVAELVRGEAFIETAVADHQLGRRRRWPLARFYRGAELKEDSSNWFTPTVAALLDWCASSGLEPQLVEAWPKRAPERAVLRARRAEGPPEYTRLSYELPLDCRVLHRRGDPAPREP
jgi:tRNA (mo5U34)-methyltransferase